MIASKPKLQLGTLMVFLACITLLSCATTPPNAPLGRDYTLESFKEASTWQNQDPVLLLTTMQMFYASGRAQEGWRHFHKLAEIYPDSALIMACEGTLMAKMAYDVPLISRIGWVKDALRKLDEAAKGGSIEPRYLKGLVEAEIPWFFNRANAAITDLNLVLNDQNKLPFEATRGIHSGLARAYFKIGDEKNGNAHMKIAGISSLEESKFLSNASVTFEDGAKFGAPRIIEIGAKFWVIQGYNYSNIFAWETSEGVVLIDAGTTISSAENAKAALKTVTQKPIHTIIVTHSHWDHIGGISVFAEPTTKIIASSQFANEIQTINNFPFPYQYFWGKNVNTTPYSLKPDHLIQKPEEITIGDLNLQLIPVSGGETTDALIIYDIQNRIAVVGDVLMPYLGSPFVSEGSPENLVQTIKILRQLEAKHLFQGHDPLMRYYDVDSLPGLEKAIEETINETKQLTAEGVSVANILRRLQLPAILKSEPHAVFPYLLMREGLIQRVAKERVVGYWGGNSEGVDPVTDEELASAIDIIGGNNSLAFYKASEELINRGDVILATRISRLGILRYPNDIKIKEVNAKAFDRLREKYHLINPFKFVIYSEMGKKELRPIDEKNP